MVRATLPKVLQDGATSKVLDTGRFQNSHAQLKTRVLFKSLPPLTYPSFLDLTGLL